MKLMSGIRKSWAATKWPDLQPDKAAQQLQDVVQVQKQCFAEDLPQVELQLLAIVNGSSQSVYAERVILLFLLSVKLNINILPTHGIMHPHATATHIQTKMIFRAMHNLL